jgi:hypothetical protein
MAEKRAKEAQEFEAKSADDLDKEKTELLQKGDNKSVTRVKLINKEIERRAKPTLDAEDTARKAVRDKIIARAKELAKAGTADADDRLTRALLALG